MMAIILAGGLGARLLPYTMNIPKPLLPLGDLPVIEIVIRQLKSQGFERVVITLGHLPHLMVAFLGDGEKFGLRIDYALEDSPLGTAGPLRHVSDIDDHVLVMNGDLLTTMDFKGLFTRHVASGAVATIALARRDVRVDYGVIHADAEGLLVRYEEKPLLEYHVSTGVYVVASGAIEHIPEGRYDMPDLMTRLQDRGLPVRCEVSDAYWQDIGRFDDYQRASGDFVREPGKFLPVGSDS